MYMQHLDIWKVTGLIPDGDLSVLFFCPTLMSRLSIHLSLFEKVFAIICL